MSIENKELWICKDCLHKSYCNKSEEDCYKYSFKDYEIEIKKEYKNGNNPKR